MAKLIFSMIASLDGYIEDAEGRFDWSEPDAEVHAFVNDDSRTVGTYLFGRRLYEVMTAWETLGTGDEDPAHIRDFARLWREADKVVYSRTLAAPSTARTRIERDFDPAVVAEMKRTADRDLAIGGPELAAQAFRTGLIDECHLFLSPVIVGGGKRALPSDVVLRLELKEQRRFDNGVVYLAYSVR